MTDRRRFIRDIPDFPKPGILFKDITPLLANANAFRTAVDQIADQVEPGQIQTVVGIESRGFIIGAAVAYRLGAGLAIVRKAGKLPHDTIAVSYDLEYGTDTLQIHRDALIPGTRVLIVDDLLATGGTAAAAVRLVEQLQGNVQGIAFLIELSALNGRSRLPKIPTSALIRY